MFGLSENIRHLGRPKAAESIAALVIELAENPERKNDNA